MPFYSRLSGWLSGGGSRKGLEGVVGWPGSGWGTPWRKTVEQEFTIIETGEEGGPLKLFRIHRHPRGILLKAFPSGSVHVFTKEKMDMAGGGCTGAA